MDLENLVSRAKWQEEDDGGDDVKDNWEDEDEEPPKPVAKSTEPKQKPANKRGTNSKNAVDNDIVSNKPMTAQEFREKRLMEEKLQKESDLRLTKQMLGMEDKDIALEFPLDTKEDFDTFHKNLVHKLWCYDKSPHYYVLLDKLFRDLCVPLEAEELKSLSSTINALFNEKVKVNKTKPKKKGMKGVAIKVERNNLMNDREDFMDELDDIINSEFTEAWLRPWIEATSDHFIGVTRLLMLVDSNRDKLEMVHDMRRIRGFQASRYDLNLKLANLDVSLSLYLSDGVIKWDGREFPLRVWLKTKQHGVFMVDYYRVETLRDQGARIDDLDYYLEPTTVELGFGCSNSLGTSEQSFPTFHEIYSMNFELVQGSTRRLEFVAYDGRQQAFRRDSFGPMASTTSLTCKIKQMALNGEVISTSGNDQPVAC